jgi:hypothetical protein
VEIVDDGRNGRHWRTPGELAVRSRELIRDGHAREALAARARRDAERYGRERFAEAVRRHVLDL